jgi:hypothetical protein
MQAVEFQVHGHYKEFMVVDGGVRSVKLVGFENGERERAVETERERRERMKWTG